MPSCVGVCSQSGGENRINSTRTIHGPCAVNSNLSRRIDWISTRMGTTYVHSTSFISHPMELQPIPSYFAAEKIPSKVLQDLLQLNLVTAPSTLTAATSFLETILEPLAESLSNRGSGPPLPEYPCVSKSSFPSLYAATWRQALASFRTIITSASDIVAGPPAPSDVLQKMLAKLEKANRVFGRLVLLTKAADKRAVSCERCSADFILNSLRRCLLSSRCSYLHWIMEIALCNYF